jgi:hypothetical protein
VPACSGSGTASHSDTEFFHHLPSERRFSAASTEVMPDCGSAAVPLTAATEAAVEPSAGYSTTAAGAAASKVKVWVASSCE